MTRTGTARHARAGTTSSLATPRRLVSLGPILAFAVLLLAVFGATPAPTTPAAPTDLPPILFVSRHPISRDPKSGIPGLGPRHRAATTGGRLILRHPDGHLQVFAPPVQIHDVSDPCVSYDGRRVAFAAVTRADSAWRIWTLDADGTNLKQVTRTDRGPIPGKGAASKVFARYDDVDPCWLPDGRLCFSSTRYPYVAAAGGLTSNLFVVDEDGRHMLRVTSERDGADEPGIDPATGRIVYARWWGSRYRATNRHPSGITTDTSLAMPAERLIVWHALSIRTDGEGIRLAGGNPLSRPQTMAYQPVMLADGTLVGVTADTLSLEPHPGRVRLAVYPGGFAPPVTFPAAPAQACSPSSLPDGRLLVSWDRNGRGDFGVAIVNRDGSGLTSIANLPGTLELDAVALVPRPLPPPDPMADLGGMPRTRPPAQLADLERESDVVRFDCLNVFANAPVDFPVPDGVPIARDLKIRFFVALSRPTVAGGDTVAFLRDAVVTRSGAVHEETIPGDLPMFEQLVDAHGHVLASASGPAHVPGFNSGRTGSGTKCVGCHVGHTTIPVALSYAQGKRFNGATSATVTATSEAPASHARAVVDRRTQGPWEQVAWVAAGSEQEAVTLKWPFAVAIDSLVVYGVRPDAAMGTDLTLAGCDVTLKKDGAVVKTLHLERGIDPAGTGLGCDGVIADVAEIRPLGARGKIGGVPRVGLAEVEARIRIPED